MTRQRYFGDRIDDLPLILAGPILRQVSETSVTVWLALTQSAQIRLNVLQTQQGFGEKPLAVQLTGQAQTLEIGVSLHLCVVTAMEGRSLLPSTIYAYDLDIVGQDCHIESLATLPNKIYGSEGLSYFDHGLPTFATPAAELSCLKLMHGSCRKPHGGGDDLLCVVDHLLEISANQAQERIQQLYFTGDQIYGDDVADPLLWVATDVGDMLLGWLENLPLSPGRWEQSFTLPPGVRSDIAKKEAGLTATIGNSDAVASSHLFSLGEYFAAYLLMWSPFLWPLEFPSGKEVQENIASGRRWDADVRALKGFISTLPKVRRALANVATYMICDDHDVSDDWYLNRDWCQRVLGKPLGYRVVMNGLLAYAFCQGWGNTPEQFVPGTTGAKLCRAIEQWSRSSAQDPLSEQAITQYLGLPKRPDHPADLFCRDQTVDILKRHPDALKWHYRVNGFCHEVLVLDTRTWRGYPDGKAIAPPMLLSPAAFQQQLTEMLKTQATESKADSKLTLLVLPTNLVSLDVIDQVQQHDWAEGQVYRNDVGDAWNFHQGAFTQLLTTLSHHREKIVLLSGDIHYSCAVKVQVWTYLHSQTKTTIPSTLPSRQMSLVQLTCSAIKNAEPATYAVHTKLKSLYRESREDWLGWKSTPQIQELIYAGGRVYRQSSAITGDQPYWHRTRPFLKAEGNANLLWKSVLLNVTSFPNWRYCTRWIPRQSALPIPYQVALAPQKSWLTSLLHPLRWIWNSRWMQEGPEVIGRNNIAVVGFTQTAETHAVNVIQDCYWIAPWQSGQVVRSRFFVSL